jgi:hypothetical protein
MRWLSSRLTCDSPWGRRVRIGSGSELEVGVLVEKRNFAELAGEFARDYFRKRHEAGPRVGRRRCDNPTRDNSLLSPKPLHLVIKR